jgi:hypothetical protein
VTNEIDLGDYEDFASLSTHHEAHVREPGAAEAGKKSAGENARCHLVCRMRIVGSELRPSAGLLVGVLEGSVTHRRPF